MNKRKRKNCDTNQETERRTSPRKAQNKTSESKRVLGEPKHLDHLDGETGARQSTSKKTKASVTPEEGYVKGYTSDGMSFESLPDDDGDMLPDINLSSPFKGKKIVKDDIVWAPFKEMYWPAVVTSVKWPKICFLFVNEFNKHVYRSHAKRLVPFDNASKNHELKERGEKAYSNFKDAYELVVKYLCKRKQNTNLNARRFLTLSDEKDKVGQAKDCLFRLTGMSDDSPYQLQDCDENDKEIDEGVDILDIDEDKIEEAEAEAHLEEKAKVDEILKDLETLPLNMTVSPEEFAQLKKQAQKLLCIIQSEDCFEYLMNIRNGIVKSSRHMKFENAEVVRGGLGPFTLFSDLTNQLLTILDNHCDEYDEPEYKHNVMLPEAIIYAIQKDKNYTKLEAKKYFHSMCKKVGVKE